MLAAGYRVGTNISPHLEAVNERFAILGRPLSDAQLSEALEAHARARDDWAGTRSGPGVPLTYFEFVTTLAMHLFAQHAVDLGVFEVGLGGRLDATNVLEPQVSAITQVGLDHTEQLGDTLEAIAGEKAGIVKRGVPVVIGAMPVEARDVILRRAEALGAPAWVPSPVTQGRARGLQRSREGMGQSRVGTNRGSLKSVGSERCIGRRGLLNVFRERFGSLLSSS
jgi:dihydrofolate synthase/folylpolyglutamate synthase